MKCEKIKITLEITLEITLNFSIMQCSGKNNFPLFFIILNVFEYFLYWGQVRLP